MFYQLTDMEINQLQAFDAKRQLAERDLTIAQLQQEAFILQLARLKGFDPADVTLAIENNRLAFRKIEKQATGAKLVKPEAELEEFTEVVAAPC